LTRSRGATMVPPLMHIESVRTNVLSVTLTATELSALVAGARMALDALRAAPPGAAPADAIETLEHVLADYDRVRDRLHGSAGGS
jgi:hypothetical protein